MLNEKMVTQLKTAYSFFQSSSACLEEEDSNFAPCEDVFTVAQQVAHVAQTIDWFIEGMFSPEGFDLDFEKHSTQISKVNSLAAARKWLKDAVDRAVNTLESKNDQELLQSLPPGPILGGVPRISVIPGVADHTAHHRGALTVYSRLLGKVPPMPYGEET